MSGRYRKPVNFQKGALATARILLTCLAVAIVGIVSVYIAMNGWEAVAEWFAGRWFALIAAVIVISACLGLWAWSLYSYLRKTGGDDGE